MNADVIHVVINIPLIPQASGILGTSLRRLCNSLSTVVRVSPCNHGGQEKAALVANFDDCRDTVCHRSWSQSWRFHCLPWSRDSQHTSWRW